MKIGTKSVLFGAHCFLIHPCFVFAAWWKLYGFPWDPRLWVAFIVHDWGYWGKPNMDGPEGETHPELGAKIMSFLFDRPGKFRKWYYFTLYHSRFLSKRDMVRYSKLCVVDKYSTYLTPAWLYIPMATLTGEIHEYMERVKPKEGGKYSTMGIDITNKKVWYKSMTTYLYKWAIEHKDLRVDTWTPEKSLNFETQSGT